MPIITVQGLPADTNEQALQSLYRACAARVALIKELKLTSTRQLTFFFPPDMMALDLGQEIIVTVDGLFVKPERTPEVRNRLAEALGETVKEYFPDAFVEVLVHSFDPAQGFWTSDKEG